MTVKERMILLALMGFGIYGAICPVISAVIETLSSPEREFQICSAVLLARMGHPLPAFVVEVVVSGLFGAVILGGTAVYAMEEWSVLRCTVTHFVPSIIALFSAAFFLGWITPSNITGCVIMFVVCVLFYVVIWLLNYLSYKAEIQRMNEELQALKAHDPLAGGQR